MESPRQSRSWWRGAVAHAIGQFMLALALVAALLAPGIPVAAGAAGPARVHPQLLQDAANHPDDTFRVIVTRQGGDTAADAYVASRGGEKLGEVGTLGFVARVKGKDIAALGAHPAVRQVSLDAPMVKTATIDTSKLGTLYTQTVGATQEYPGGVTGAGIGVAVLDTGINKGLADFNDTTGASRVVAQVKFNSNTSSMADGMGHGTHVAGIIAGNSWQSANGTVQGKYIGVAPGANLINVKVADDTGMSYTSDVANAIEWAISNRATYNIRVLNLSMVAATAESATTSALDAEVEKAWFNGILVTVSAGNAGPNTMLYPPANDPFVITVGAADTMGTLDQHDDTMAPWSSYGTTQDGYSKPDVVAPGRSIISTLASNSCTLAQQFPSRITDGNYIWMSGTSMAAPVVAGEAALAFQAHPTWTNDQVKWLLMQTATPLGTTTNGTFTPIAGSGSGEASASAVVGYAGTPGYANQGLPINQNLVGPGGATTYNNGTTGTTTSSWSTSSWSTSSWSTSSWSTSSWSTSSWSTST